MKLEEIQEHWSKDSQIDITNLAEESIRTPMLHSKYLEMYSAERLTLRKYEADAKRLKLAKHEFFTMGPTDETRKAGWRHPPRGMILKQEVGVYTDADEDIIALNLKIALQQEKVDTLDSILRMITNRGFAVKNAIDFMKWSMGG